jgi:hypothetical protein
MTRPAILPMFVYLLPQERGADPLPSNDKGDTHIVTDWFMNYAAEIGSGVMIYIPSFIKICSGIQK